MSFRKQQYKNLDKWKATNKKYKQRYYGATRNAENSKMPYTEKEIALILNHTMTDRELSKTIGRSMQAIQTKRSKLKKRKVVV